jgi:hypothetical protein
MEHELYYNSQIWTLFIILSFVYVLEKESSTQKVFQIICRMMDNLQNCDGYINIPSSQAYRSRELD